MDRRQFIAASGATAVAVAVPAGAAPTAADKQLHALLDTLFYARLDHSPEGATQLGLDVGPRAGMRSKLNDESLARRPVELARARAEQAMLRKIDRNALSDAAKVDYDVVDYQISRGVEGGARFTYGSSMGRFSPYVLSQLTGP
ncbi:MAG TPA: DUF885 domain-containing protein, partial [Sphingomicrobium sp.]